MVKEWEIDEDILNRGIIGNSTFARDGLISDFERDRYIRLLIDDTKIAWSNIYWRSVNNVPPDIIYYIIFQLYRGSNNSLLKESIKQNFLNNKFKNENFF